MRGEQEGLLAPRCDPTLHHSRVLARAVGSRPGPGTVAQRVRNSPPPRRCRRPPPPPRSQLARGPARRSPYPCEGGGPAQRPIRTPTRVEIPPSLQNQLKLRSLRTPNLALGPRLARGHDRCSSRGQASFRDLLISPSCSRAQAEERGAPSAPGRPSWPPAPPLSLAPVQASKGVLVVRKMESQESGKHPDRWLRARVLAMGRHGGRNPASGRKAVAADLGAGRVQLGGAGRAFSRRIGSLAAVYCACHVFERTGGLKRWLSMSGCVRRAGADSRRAAGAGRPGVGVGSAAGGVESPQTGANPSLSLTKAVQPPLRPPPSPPSASRYRLELR